jgi:hypothetical protein
MNGVGWLLVPEVWTEESVDNEAEDVDQHDTSCVCQFAKRNFRVNKLSN